MTTIAYRAGILAADRLVVADGVVTGEIQKIAKREGDSALIGVAGNSALGQAVIKWFLDGENDPRPSFGDQHSDTAALVIRPDGAFERHTMYGIDRPDCEFYADGAGWKFALAAMEIGCGAVEAVEIAIRRCVYSGGGVDWVALPGVRDPDTINLPSFLKHPHQRMRERIRRGMAADPNRKR